MATGMTGLIFYEPVSSQIDWLWGLVTASFEDLEHNFANALVPDSTQQFFPRAEVLFPSKNPYAVVRTLDIVQTRIPQIF